MARRIVRGVLRTRGGGHLVLVKQANRVQVYDADWHFTRGWFSPSALSLRGLPDGNVEVLAKGLRGFVYDLNGNLLTQRAYQVREFVQLENSLLPGVDANVPTSPWLYVFSSPLLSWIACIAGAGLNWGVAWPRSASQNGANLKTR